MTNMEGATWCMQVSLFITLITLISDFGASFMLHLVEHTSDFQ